MHRSVLLVHHDPDTLKELEQELLATAGDWIVTSASTPADALARVTTGTFDVVVADVRARGLANVGFLDQVAVRQPKAVRLLLSGGGRGIVMRAGGAAHQHVETALDSRAAFARLAQTLALGDLLTDTGLKALVSQLRAVPSLPTVYLAIMAELRKEEPSGQRVGELVSKDPGMSAKILQLVNSPLFYLTMPATEPAHAVNLLGLETVRALVLSLHIFEQLDNKLVTRFRLGKVWRHSLVTSAYARLIARLQESPYEVIAETFTAALMHDIGTLVLASSLPKEFGEALAVAERDNLPLWKAERAVFGCSHAEVGGYLLAVWGLPDSIIEAVAFHHQPSACPSTQFCPLIAIHVANTIEHEAHPADIIGQPAVLDDEYLQRLTLSWRLPAWRAACVDSAGEQQGWGLAARM